MICGGILFFICEYVDNQNVSDFWHVQNFSTMCIHLKMCTSSSLFPYFKSFGIPNREPKQHHELGEQSHNMNDEYQILNNVNNLGTSLRLKIIH